jgi:hypothetical protein
MRPHSSTNGAKCDSLGQSRPNGATYDSLGHSSPNGAKCDSPGHSSPYGTPCNSPGYFSPNGAKCDSLGHSSPYGTPCNSPGYFSPNGAKCDSLGQRPRLGALEDYRALKGRSNRGAALSGLGVFLITGPRVSPWAVISCPVGAEEGMHHTNREGMGYGG